jgi:hypothetical protein
MIFSWRPLALLESMPERSIAAAAQNVIDGADSAKDRYWIRKECAPGCKRPFGANAKSRRL